MSDADQPVDPPAPSLAEAPAVDGYALAASCVALFVAVAALFGKAVGFGDVGFDDHFFVFNNERVAEGLTLENLAWAMTSFEASAWYPVTWISHMIDAMLYGMNPAGHHATNVLIHAVTSVLLLLTLARMTGALWPSLFVAAIFAVHPVRIESVAWIAERKGVLSGMFCVAALLAYAWYARKPSLGRYVLVFLAMLLSVMSKSAAIALPFALLLLDYWPLRRWPDDPSGGGRFASASLKRLVLEKLPLLLLTAADIVIVSILLRDHATHGTRNPEPFADRAMMAIESYVMYLADTFWPAQLWFPHLVGDTVGVTTGLAFGGLLLAITLAVVVAAWRYDRRYAAVGWLWFAGMLVPVSGLAVQIHDFSRADRYVYLPSIGVIVAVVWLVHDATRRARLLRRGAAVLGVVVVLALAVTTFGQLDRWRNAEALFEHTLRLEPGNRVAHNNLARIHEDRGRFDRALSHYRAALAAVPAHDPRHPNHLYNVADALQKLGRFDEAIELYAEANRAAGENGLPAAHNNLGMIALERGDDDAAEQHFADALAADKTYALAAFNLGHIALRRGNLDAAAGWFRQANDNDPEHAASSYNLGLTLGRLNRIDEAIEPLKRAVELEPDNQVYRRALGKGYMGTRQSSKAIEVLESLVRDAPKDAEAHAQLGMALANTNRLEAAAEHLRTAVRLSPSRAGFHQSLGVVLTALGRSDDAESAFEEARRLRAVEPGASDSRD